MSSKKSERSKDSLQIYARVRGLMPWEPKKVSLKVVGNTVQVCHIINILDMYSI